MTEKDYLPQYAAEAVRDLEFVSGVADHMMHIPIEQRHVIRGSTRATADLLRNATHLVLPEEGEIYRDHKTPPTKEEAQSFAGIPAPIVSIEYAMRPDGEVEDEFSKGIDINGFRHRTFTNAKAAIVILVDIKQLYPNDVDLIGVDNNSTPVLLTSVLKFDKPYKTLPEVSWTTTMYGMMVGAPLEFMMRKDDGRDTLYTPHRLINVTDMVGRGITVNVEEQMSQEHQKRILGGFHQPLSAALQMCHALRVGATLEARKEKSYTRNRTLEKKGVGGFEYHVLKLPYGTVKETLGSRCGNSGGERDGPRYHFRRAHLRNLSKGTQTFVRSCFVGNRDKGMVEKEYKLDKGVAA